MKCTPLFFYRLKSFLVNRKEETIVYHAISFLILILIIYNNLHETFLFG